MSDKRNIVEEEQVGYAKQETDQLRAALRRSYAERFRIMTSLMKMDIMFRRARITHKSFTPTK